MLRCVRALAPNASVDWRGNLLVMKNVDQRREGEYEDASLADIEPVRAYFVHYRDG